MSLSYAAAENVLCCTGVRFADAATGKAIGEPLKHSMEIVEIALSQSGPSSARKIAFLDRNMDLYLAEVHRPEPFKLATVVDSFAWNDSTDILAAVADRRFFAWLFPGTINVDRDLLSPSCIVKEVPYAVLVRSCLRSGALAHVRLCATEISGRMSSCLVSSGRAARHDGRMAPF